MHCPRVIHHQWDHQSRVRRFVFLATTTLGFPQSFVPFCLLHRHSPEKHVYSVEEGVHKLCCSHEFHFILGLADHLLLICFMVCVLETFIIVITLIASCNLKEREPSISDELDLVSSSGRIIKDVRSVGCFFSGNVAIMVQFKKNETLDGKKNRKQGKITP